MDRKWWYLAAGAVVAHAAVGFAVPALFRGQQRYRLRHPTAVASAR
jgi:hypothetical protein